MTSPWDMAPVVTGAAGALAAGALGAVAVATATDVVLLEEAGLAAAGVMAVGVVVLLAAVRVVPAEVASVAPVRGSVRAPSALATSETGVPPRAGTIGMVRGAWQ